MAEIKNEIMSDEELDDVAGGKYNFYRKYGSAYSKNGKVGEGIINVGKSIWNDVVDFITGPIEFKIAQTTDNILLGNSDGHIPLEKHKLKDEDNEEFKRKLKFDI